jgi:hypothetical protein
MQTMQTESPKRVKPFVPDFEVVLPHTHMRLEHCISTGATRSVWVGRDGKQHRRWLVKWLTLSEHLALATFGLNYESATWFGLMGELVGYTKLTELPLCMRGRVVVRRQLSDRCRNWLPNEELGS